MPRTGKSRENDESKNSSSESSRRSNSSSKDFSKKSKKITSKHKNQEDNSSSSQSDSESLPTSSSIKGKKPDSCKRKFLKHSRTNKELSHDYKDYNKYNNWTTGVERSKWDSPNREMDNEYVGRNHQSDYYRNEISPRYNDRNRDRGKKKDANSKDWRNSNRSRYSRKDQMNRNYDKKSRYHDIDNRNRGKKSQERPPHKRENNERRQEGRQSQQDKRKSRSQSPGRLRKFPRKSEEDNRTYQWGKKEENRKEKDEASDSKSAIEKEKPNFGLSGKLTEDTNKVNGIVIKYSEPPEARKPKRRWRLYPFKGEKALPTLYIHRQSCYLIGRDHNVCDLPVDHPSCSKQHAALQYRLVPFERENGTVGKRVRLYLIDLDSANGTFLNNQPIEPRKYFELLEKDVIKFGFSSREYVLLHENSKEEDQDDDIQFEDVQVKEEPTD